MRLRLALCAVLQCSAAIAQDAAVLDAQNKHVGLERVETGPVIDGRLDDDVWQNATIVEDLHQVNPEEYAAPSETTRVMLLYDRDFLYVGVRMFDRQPESINARVLRQGQAIGPDDRFFLHIDPFNNRRSGYVFGVNPNGVRYDGIYENITQRSFDWDGIWLAEAAIDAQGWVAEIAIPFKTLSFDPNSDTWRMNFIRTIQRLNETVAWSSRNRQTDLSTMGEVSGISRIQQGKGLDIVPSATHRDRKDFFGAPTETDTEPSLDIFYKITPSLNGSLTLNTDFSATEVDSRQINLTRFNLFFPERRDFFLQDSDIFQFGRLSQNGTPFFSRSIGIGADGSEIPLAYGGKLSGRVGRFDIGALAVRQDRSGSLEPSTALVGRVAANVLAESSAGIIITDGDPQSNLDNRVIGTDFRYFNSRLPGGRSIEAEVWLQQSDTPGVASDDRAAGFGFQMPTSHGFQGGITAQRIEQNFNPAMGFVNRRGILWQDSSFGYVWRPRSTAVRTFATNIFYNRIEYLDNGDVQSQAATLQMNLELNSQDNFGIGFNENKEGLRSPFEISPGIVIAPGLYTFNVVELQLRTGQQRKYGAGIFINDGEFYDGTRDSIGGFIGFRPSPHFRANIQYQYNDISLPKWHCDISLPSCDFDTRLARLQLEAIFSSKLSWVNLFQYDNVSKTIGINSRLHWIPRAGRESFLVLNHNLEDFDGDGRFHSAVAEVAVKFSYTFRF